MKELADIITARNRFSHELYAIELQNFQKIVELIHLYHESIYDLPDEERIEASRLNEDDPHKTYLVKVNELVFV